MGHSAIRKLPSVLMTRAQRKHFFQLIFSGTGRKHAFEWVRSMTPGYLLDAPSPWITFDAIDRIKSRLGERVRVFEYGSGGSTLFWLSFGCMCVSIEHDPDWYREISGLLPDGSSLEYRLVPPESPSIVGGEEADRSDPYAYRSGDDKFTGCSFLAYATQIDSYPNESFDIVLVDGRARPSCIMHSVGKVKKGGMLVLDNADRKYYTKRTRSFLADFEVARFAGPIPSLSSNCVTDIYTRMR